jgi:2-keto-4-pentenoate hydratase/2-oxohepta-3-ene-1,7-dioic acid hydratase in catechol pathway
VRLITRQAADGESLAVVDGQRWMDASDVLPGGATTMMTLVAGGDAAPRTSAMYFGIAEIIAHCSRAFTLEPGDVIATGTPGGVGVFRDPPRFLADGDRVVVEIERIGRLENVCRLVHTGAAA